MENGITRKRLIFLLVLCAAGVLLGQIYMKRQWLRYRREQALTEITSFVANSHQFDGVTGAALSLVQEVELVSRGYRMFVPVFDSLVMLKANNLAVARHCPQSAVLKIGHKLESASAYGKH